MKNWKTTLSELGVAITAGLAALAAAPAQLGDVSTILPEKYKSYIFATGLIAAFLLRVIKGSVTADAGTVQNPITQQSPKP